MAPKGVNGWPSRVRCGGGGGGGRRTRGGREWRRRRSRSWCRGGGWCRVGRRIETTSQKRGESYDGECVLHFFSSGAGRGTQVWVSAAQILSAGQPAIAQSRTMGRSRAHPAVHSSRVVMVVGSRLIMAAVARVILPPRLPSARKRNGPSVHRSERRSRPLCLSGVPRPAAGSP